MRAVIGIVGLGGGGSHIAQQLAHVGVQNYILFDPDAIEESNLNRLIGATVKDPENKALKVAIAEERILGLQPKAKVNKISQFWQNNPLPLSTCDIVFGCLDGYQARQELESYCRRHLIPYIDIGIDVHQVEPEPPRLSGQVIASLPGGPCLRCIGYITEAKIAKEVSKYGAAGSHPQVVWANGVVASTAVGIAVDLLTGWTKCFPDVVYLSYEGNLGIMTPHKSLNYIKKPCVHYPAHEVGEPVFRAL